MALSAAEAINPATWKSEVVALKMDDVRARSRRKVVAQDAFVRVGSKKWGAKSNCQKLTRRESYRKIVITRQTIKIVITRH